MNIGNIIFGNNKSGNGRTTINGVELPEDFNVGNIINNIAISKDGKSYAAVTKSKDLIIGQIPENGKIEVDGHVITYKKSAGGTSVSSVYKNSIVASGNSLIIGGTNNGSVIISGSNLECAVDKGYENVHVIKSRGDVNDISLCFSDDAKVYVKGNAGAEPKYESGELSIKDLDGMISTPKSDSNLELDIKSAVGNIRGDVANGGKIKTDTGNITINLYAPISIEAKTDIGKINVYKMISEGHGKYSPPNAESSGVLTLKSAVGNITVNYLLN